MLILERLRMKVLYLDIETAPIEAHTWGLWQQNVGLNQIMRAPRVLCFATKWQGLKPVTFASEFGVGRLSMLEQAHALLSEADVVVHYNGKRFDIPWLNAEFVVEGMKPPAPYAQIDLCNVVKSRFRFPSNKLQYVSEVLGIGSKVSHEGHTLWTKCLAGDVKAWKDMEKYNRQDTVLLEALHAKLLPWITTHPNRRLFDAEAGCPNCGKKNLRREGFAYTLTGRYQRFQCRDCGAWGRAGKRIEGTDIRGAAA
jgi:DNA polymerase elongation subunit (family B)